MIKRAITCPTCGVEVEVRNGQMAFETLGNHKRKEGHK